MALTMGGLTSPRLSLGRDVAVDLGTGNTRVYVRGSGTVISEPSVVAVQDRTGDVLAVGLEARGMLGRTPDGITALRPLRAGVISDYDAAERMLRFFIQKAIGRTFFSRPRIVVCVPSHLTTVEQRAVRDAAYAAGARQVYALQTPLAAAIGAQLPIHESTGYLVVDIGAGNTHVAVIALGGVVSSDSSRLGGDSLDEAIVRFLADHFDLLVGPTTAEAIKLQIGSAYPIDGLPTLPVSGRDTRTGLPRKVELSPSTVRKALQPPIAEFVTMLRRALDQCPPEVAGDLLRTGITLTGGGSLLAGLDHRISHELGLPVQRAEDPASSVVLGAGQCVEHFSTLRGVLLTEPG